MGDGRINSGTLEQRLWGFERKGERVGARDKRWRREE